MNSAEGDEKHPGELLRDSLMRADVARKNKDALIAVMQEYPAIHIRKSDIDSWRPTKRTTGDIPGLLAQLEILCTDGNIGWFAYGESRCVLHGHVQYFSGKVEPLFSVPKPTAAKPTKKREKRSSVQLALDLLNKLKGNAA